MVLVALKDAAPVFADKAKYRKSVKWALSTLARCQVSDDPLHSYEVRRAPHVTDLIRKIPHDGGSRTDLPTDLQLACHQKCDGFKDVYGRMSWEQPAPTITGGCINPSKGRFLHPTEDRAITLREAAVLQGFSRSYRFDTSKGRYPVAQMIGNAFPPKFAEMHAAALLKEISAAGR
jgi:DNA (cytosine-5)-methyltransferase 1